MFKPEDMQRIHYQSIGRPLGVPLQALNRLQLDMYWSMAILANEQIKPLRELLAEMTEFFKYDQPHLTKPLREWQAERDTLIARARTILAESEQ